MCTPEQRREILGAFLAEGPREMVAVIDSALASQMHFRPAGLRSMDPTRKVERIVERLEAKDLQSVLKDCLVWFHVTKRVELMSRFLDLCGMAHKDGVVDTGAPPPPPDVARQALSDLSAPQTQVATYLATAGLVMGQAWQAVMWPLVATMQAVPPTPEPAVVTRPPGPHGAEDAQDFTTLDDVLIKSIVASVSGIEGALSEEQAEDLVEEVIHLNQSRHRSYFHRGFLHGLSGRPRDTAPLEANAARRAWLLTGRLMALVRRGQTSVVVEEFQGRRAEFDELMRTEAAIGAAAMAAPHLFDALWKSGAFADAAIAVSPTVGAAAGPGFVNRLLGAVREMFLSHRTPEATLLLDKVDAVLSSFDAGTVPGDVTYEVHRRRAQVRRAGGDFREAEEAFAVLAEASGPERRSELLADIALCRGAFKWLAEVEVPREESAVHDTLKRLEAGAAAAEEAASEPGGAATNAQHLLGVRALLREKYDEARGLLEQAVSGMSPRVGLYPDVLPRCRLYYALSILLSGQVAQFRVALSILNELGSDESLGEWPEWLLRKALDMARADYLEGVYFAEWAGRRFPDLLDEFVHDSYLVRRSEQIRTELQFKAASNDRPLALRQKDYEALLLHAQREGDVAAARTALEGLERLALDSPAVRRAFADALGSESYYEPAWTWEEAQYARAQLLEADGRYAEGGGVLASLIHSYLSQDEAEEARGLYERLQGYGSNCPEFPEITARMAAFIEAPAPEAPPPAGGEAPKPVRVLFLGGNEVQARYDEWIQAELGRLRTGVTVTFLHTGWDGNWGPHAERIRQLMPTHDSAVIMRFIRTELGRTARDDVGKAGKRWVACTGHGRDSMLRAVLNAANAARGRPA